VEKKLLKLTSTIADLAGTEAITKVHLAEALQYRPKLELMRGFIIKRFANVSTERKKFSDLFMNMENLDSNHLITS